MGNEVIERAAQILPGAVAELKESNDAELTPRQRDEYRSYIQTAFHGANDDWTQWIESPRELLLKVREISDCARWHGDHEDALRQIQLLLSLEITKAARGHVEQCEKNGWPE